jgi:hypothetical protein
MSNSSDFSKSKKAVCANCIYYVAGHDVIADGGKPYPTKENIYTHYDDMCHQNGFTKNPTLKKNKDKDCKGFVPRRKDLKKLSPTQRYGHLVAKPAAK